MANSLITRCPKCSTAFRVSDEVLSMAKGKVRCGQCFHIFDAANSQTVQAETALKTETAQQTEVVPKKVDTPIIEAEPSKITAKEVENTRPSKNEKDFITEEEILNLFDENDLRPPSEPAITDKKSSFKEQKFDIKDSKQTLQQEPAKQYEERAKSARSEVNNELHADKSDELAPWEVELAEVEAALSARPYPQKAESPKVTEKPKATEKTTAKANGITKLTTHPSTYSPTQKAEDVSEPDYMVALQSLAQTASEQTRPSDIKSQHTILEQLSAQESLAPLLEENESNSKSKNKPPWLWFLASLLGLALLASH